MLNRKQILEIALEQSAVDCNCRASDFLKDGTTITRSVPSSKVRKYLPLPLECDLVSYGTGIVAQVSERTEESVQNYISRYPSYRCFETPQIGILEQMLRPFGLKVCFQAEYFLPDPDKIPDFSFRYRLQLLYHEDFALLYRPEWSNALCEPRKELDILGLGAYDGDRLIGLAACSADCEEMYQIGIDVLPEYRRQGIGSVLTSRLAKEILSLNKVPFYCAAWSNIRSAGNAYRCGFLPAWCELTARDRVFTDTIAKG